MYNLTMDGPWSRRMVLRFRQKMVGFHKTRMVEKVLGRTGGIRLAVLLGCAFGVMSCAGGAATVSRSRGALAEVPAAHARNEVATSEYLRARAQALRTTIAALPLSASSAEAAIARTL